MKFAGFFFVLFGLIIGLYFFFLSIHFSFTSLVTLGVILGSAVIVSGALLYSRRQIGIYSALFTCSVIAGFLIYHFATGKITLFHQNFVLDITMLVMAALGIAICIIAWPVAHTAHSRDVSEPATFTIPHDQDKNDA